MQCHWGRQAQHSLKEDQSCSQPEGGEETASVAVGRCFLPGSPASITPCSHRGMGPTRGFWGTGVARRVGTTLLASPHILSSVCIPSSLPTPTATRRQGARSSITNQEVSTEPAGDLTPGAFSRRDQELEWGPQPGHKAPW